MIIFEYSVFFIITIFCSWLFRNSVYYHFVIIAILFHIFFLLRLLIVQCFVYLFYFSISMSDYSVFCFICYFILSIWTFLNVFISHFSLISVFASSRSRLMYFWILNEFILFRFILSKSCQKYYFETNILIFFLWQKEKNRKTRNFLIVHLLIVIIKFYYF